MVNIKNLIIATFAVALSLRGDDNHAAILNSKLPSNMKIELNFKNYVLIGLGFLVTYTLPLILLINNADSSEAQYKLQVDKENQHSIEQIKQIF